MEKKTEFVIRREDPYDRTYHHDNEDINTMCAKKVFEGVVAEMNVEDGKITFIGGEKKILNYDILSDIEGYCYVREIEIKPGTHHEKWREPTDFELDEFIILLKDIYDQEGDINRIKEDIIYSWYISKKRDSKINNILNEK